ncbi:hypothetical protein EH196_17000 [Bacillus sp. C1-1]|nr:hypothetical protein EH196_17000 [Bacillus sp. C1-1]
MAIFRSSKEGFASFISSCYNKRLASALKVIMVKFTANNLAHTAEQLRSRREMIAQLSAPIIKLRKGIALLPLVGELEMEWHELLFT